MESVWGKEGLEGDKDNIPRFSLCWYVAVGREREGSFGQGSY